MKGFEEFLYPLTVGLKQEVEIAGVHALGVSIFLMDEVFSGLR